MKNTILVVEDSATARAMIKIAIEESTPYKCHFTKTFNEAQEALTQYGDTFFASVLDLNLPDAPNGEIVDMVLKHGIPSIVFTGKMDDETIVMFQKKPIVEYIVKNSPKAAKELSTVINNLDLNQHRTVLVVDDSKTSRMYLKSLLETHLFNVLEAENGIEALRMMELHPEINLILTDFHMPEMDGFELTSRIRMKFSPEEKAILAVTVDNHPLNIAHFLKNGANDFISKPVKKEEYYSRIYGLIRMTDSHHKALEAQKLLQEHKEAVDNRSIVSKTDLNGKIIYANDNFVKISGYSRDELIGKNHSIVRHPDMPREVYSQIWDDIKEKQTWHGILKNKNKEGYTYIVDATIKPLFDLNGEIKEYIGIHHDLTALLSLQQDIIDTQKEMIETLGEVAESRSKETGKHVKRVAEYSALLGILHGLESDDITMLRLGSPMHDIGKVAIPDHILLKPGKLEPDEYEIMKLHAQKGYDILKTANKPILSAAATIALQHHERWDGKGYPQGLAGEDIHIFGRITAIADVFDALSTQRVYKPAWSMDQILTHMNNEKGSQFDPDLITLFLDNIDSFLEIRETYKNEIEPTMIFHDL